MEKSFYKKEQKNYDNLPLHIIADALPNGVILFDYNSIIVYINDYAANLFQYSKDEITGQNLDILIPSTFKKKHKEFMASFRENPSKRNMGDGRELLGLKKDGKNFPLEIGLSPIYTPHGDLILASLLDISGRKKLIRRFNLLVDSTPNSMVIIDNKGIIKQANKETQRQTGFMKNELEGESLENLIPEEYIEKYRIFLDEFMNIPIARALGKGRDLYVKRCDGSSFPVEIKLKPIETEDDILILVTLLDITERKKYENELIQYNEELMTSLEKIEQQRNTIKESEEKYKAVIANMDDIFYRTDNNQRLTIVSPSALKYTEYEKVEDLLGKNVPETFYHNPEDTGKMLEILKENNGKVTNFELLLKAKGGKLIEFETNSHFIYDDYDNIIGIEGVLRDISEKKKAEKKLRESEEKIRIAHRNITDSIDFAKTIQQSLLTNEKLIDSYFKRYFLLFKPKDKVSGDFYYINKIGSRIYFTVADCTGHGVPGAFLSIIGITYIHEIVRRKKVENPAIVLNTLRERIKRTFNAFGNESTNGFDIAFCILNIKNNVLQYSGAFNPLVLIRDSKLHNYPAVRNPVGYYLHEESFKNKEIQLLKGDQIYLFSDGFQDQFGGQLNRKFSSKAFKDLLLEVSALPIDEQKEALESSFEKWRKNNEQIDDITVLGIEI